MWAIALTGAHPGTTVVAVSRHGLLPHVHCWPRHTPSVVSEPVVASHAAPLRLAWLIRQVRAIADSQAGDWQDVIEALRPQIPRLWQQLPDTDKRLFLRHVARYWEVHRHLMPPATAEQVKRLRASGRLVVLRGRVVSAAQRAEGIRVGIDLGDSQAELHAGWLVNCCGPGSDIAGTGDPLLLGNLFETGLARPDSLETRAGCRLAWCHPGRGEHRERRTSTPSVRCFAVFGTRQRLSRKSAIRPRASPRSSSPGSPGQALGALRRPSRSGRSRSRRSAGRSVPRTAARSGPPRRCGPASSSVARKNAQFCETRAACCMLWVTMTIVTWSRSSAMVSSIRRVEVGSSAEHGSSISSTSGRDRQRPGDAQPLLLAAGQRAAGRPQPAVHLVPQAGPAQAGLHDVVLVGDLDAGQLQPARHVVVDRHRRERVRLLEHHADPPAHLGRPLARVVDVVAVEQHLAGQRGAADHLVHPVEDPQEGGLAAAGRPDQRGDRCRAPWSARPARAPCGRRTRPIRCARRAGQRPAGRGAARARPP